MNGFHEDFGGQTSQLSNASLQHQVRALENLFVTKKEELVQCENKIRILENNLQKICGRVCGIFEDLSYSAVEKIRADICRSVCGSKVRDLVDNRPVRGGWRSASADENSYGLRSYPPETNGFDSDSDYSVASRALSKLPKVHRPASVNTWNRASESEDTSSRVSQFTNGSYRDHSVYSSEKGNVSPRRYGHEERASDEGNGHPRRYGRTEYASDEEDVRPLTNGRAESANENGDIRRYNRAETVNVNGKVRQRYDHVISTNGNQEVSMRSFGRGESASENEDVCPSGYGREDSSENEDAYSRVSHFEDDRVYVYVCADDTIRFAVSSLERNLQPDHRVEHMISSTRLMEEWTYSLLRKQERGKFVAGDVVVLLVGRLDAIKRRVFEMRDQLKMLLAGLSPEIGVVVVGVTGRFDLDPEDMININIKRLNFWIREVLCPWSHRAGFVDVSHLSERDFKGKFLTETGQRQVVFAIEEQIREVRQRCLATCGHYARG